MSDCASRDSGSRISRRVFVASAVAGVGTLVGTLAGTRGLLAAPSARDAARLTFTPHAPTETIPPRMHDLAPRGVSGKLFVPAGYRPDTQAPLAILLHGAGHRSREWMQDALKPVFDAQRAVILAPDSTGGTWDMMLGGFGPDVQVIDRAVAAAFRCCNIAPRAIALGGFSDGASYALSLGTANGDLFRGLIALSPGFMEPPAKRGLPHIFISHGTRDSILPIDRASRRIVPSLKSQGYDVTYKEFDGVHAIYVSEVADALKWLEGVPQN